MMLKYWLQKIVPPNIYITIAYYFKELLQACNNPFAFVFCIIHRLSFHYIIPKTYLFNSWPTAFYQYKECSNMSISSKQNPSQHNRGNPFIIILSCLCLPVCLMLFLFSTTLHLGSFRMELLTKGANHFYFWNGTRPYNKQIASSFVSTLN